MHMCVHMLILQNHTVCVYKKMVCHNSFDVELLYITKTPNRRCLSTKTPEVTTKTPVVTTKTPWK